MPGDTCRSRPGPLQQAVRGGRRDPEQVGDLRRVPAETSRRISTARCRPGRYCSAATSASRTLSRDTATPPGRPGRGGPARPGPAGSHRTSGRTGQARRPGHRPERPVPRAAAAGRGSRSRAGRRWSRCGTARYAATTCPGIAVGPPGPDQGLLHLVFGVVDRPEHPVAVRQNSGRNGSVSRANSSLPSITTALPVRTGARARARHRYRSAGAAEIIGPAGGEFRPPPGSVPVAAGKPAPCQGSRST